MKEKSKPLAVVIPDLIRCDNPACHGGVISGLFGSKNPCYKCNGSGLLDKNTVEAVDPVLMVYALTEQIKQLQIKIKALEANQKPLEEFHPHAGASKALGGRRTMD
ncbi:hypothetical protein [Neptunomonas japonica]|uniref:Uncharacterized protein n=1 Tax=Neptunomonas japonica JAMM 1380 TaxID=1441457 RepID=A0A7R6PFU3_9GAMM|nr:hypothetical protein [Neptunomonas japonica]BBB29362.1 hypothetical protein NEJAP_1410 [Neptunomonas japonica JAMM 1380]